jgi:hypothetical protein
MNTCSILVGKPEGKRQLGRPRSRCEDNIKMGVREVEWGSMDWIHLAQDRHQYLDHVNTIMKLRVPENMGKFFSIYATGGFSRRTQLHGVS